MPERRRLSFGALFDVDISGEVMGLRSNPSDPRSAEVVGTDPRGALATRAFLLRS